MKRFKLLFSVSAVIACVWAAGCSKNKDTANNASGTGTGSSSESIQTEPADPVTMKLNWEVGKIYEQEMNMSQTARIEVPGLPEPMNQNMTMSETFSISVLQAMPDGGKELELKFLTQKMTSKMGTNTMIDFDSARDPKEDGPNPAAPTFRKMLGAHIKYLLDANGKLVKLEGMDEFLQQMSGGDPQSAAMLKNLMSEDTLKQMVAREQGLPTKPVKVGDKWPINLDVNAGQMGAMQMKMNYNFKGWQQHDGKKCALLDFTGAISSKPQANPGAMSISIDNGKISGKTWFDSEIGMVMETTMDQNMTMKITAQGKNMSSQMKQTVSTKVTKISALPK